METSTDRKPGGPFSKKLREALGMITEIAPPPWLVNMQRYGPPPSYPNLSIPGLNAPLTNDQCQYGYHTGGWGKSQFERHWFRFGCLQHVTNFQSKHSNFALFRFTGKPPVDAYGRPLYGGNPFDPPGSGKQDNDSKTGIVTSDGKTIAKSPWGRLPTGDFFDEEHPEEEDSSSEEESSGDEMDESDAEEGADGIESVLPPPQTTTATAPGDLRKQPAGDETPMVDAAPKPLYQVLQTSAAGDNNQGGVFQSDVKYVVPGTTAAVPEGAESVLSKAIAPSETAKRKRKHDDEDDEDLGKNFKF